jgi:hypothetical protein
LLATVGASTCLVLAGALALLAVSAMITFRGWPGEDGIRLTTEATELADVSPRPVPPRAAESGARALVIASAPRVRPAASGAARVAIGRPWSAGRAQRLARLVPRHVRAPESAAPPTPVVAPRPAVPQVQVVSRRVGNGLGDAVQGTGKHLSDGLRPVSPELADTVERLTRVLGDTVRGVGGGVVSLLQILQIQR